MKRSYILLLILLLSLAILLVSCNKDEEPEKKDHEHTYVENVIAPTCTTGGHTDMVCKICGDTIYCDYKPPIQCTSNDSWVVTKEPTCTEIGEKQQLCKFCGKTILKEPIALAEHQPVSTITKAPTCLNEGIKSMICSVCNKSLSSENIPTIETHDFEITTIPPTASTQGKTIYTCKLCKHSEEGEYISNITSATATEIYEKISKATVRIEAYDKGGKFSSIGSGFLITTDGKIVTNYHVIVGGYTLKVKFYDGTTYNVSKVLGYNKAQDVAILKINVTNANYLEISEQNVKTGDTVYALGNPFGVNNIFTSGIVSNQSMTISGKECIAFTAPISPGNSGGPLVNDQGKVVGINTMYIPDAQNLNFAVSIDKAISLDISKSKTTQDLYSATLKQNAYEIFASYIINNADSVNGDIYTMKAVQAEQNGNVGFDFRYSFDSDKSKAFLEIFVLQGGQYQFALTIVVNQGTKVYDVTMLDYLANQITIEATIDASKSMTTYADSFKNFNISVFRYNSEETDKNEIRKQLFFDLYNTAVQEFKNFLGKSYTGLTLSEFFPNWNYTI